MEDEVKDIYFLPQSVGVHVKQTDMCSVCGRKRRSSEVLYVRQRESMADLGGGWVPGGLGQPPSS